MWYHYKVCILNNAMVKSTQDSLFFFSSWDVNPFDLMSYYDVEINECLLAGGATW